MQFFSFLFQERSSIVHAHANVGDKSAGYGRHHRNFSCVFLKTHSQLFEQHLLCKSGGVSIMSLTDFSPGGVAI